MIAAVYNATTSEIKSDGILLLVNKTFADWSPEHIGIVYVT